jgi:hypothetical protein
MNFCFLKRASLFAVINSAIFMIQALPPGQPPMPHTGNSLTVHDNSSSASVPTDPTDMAAEDPALYGKPISGELKIEQLASPLADVPGASGVKGDYLLQNKKISVVVNHPDHAVGSAISGGYIIDGFINERPAERIGQLHLYLNDHYPRMAKFKNAQIVTDGKTTTAVALLVSGVDSEDPTIDLASTYTLQADTNFVHIETSITPREKPLKDFKLGDAFAWGQAQQWAPGMGLDVEKKFQVDWMGGTARGVAYGYYSPDTPNLWGPVGSTWVDLNVSEANLLPGQSTTFRRCFVVGRDLAEVTSTYFRDQNKNAVQLTGKVTEAESKRPASGVRVTALRDGKPYTEAVSRNGAFEFLLKPGAYTFQASDAIRSVLTPPPAVTLAAGAPAQPLEFQVSSPAVLNFQVEDADSGEPLPARVRMFGRGNTPDPDLGPANETRGRNLIYIPKGILRVPVPDGEYDLVFSRGIEYDMTTIPVTLERNKELPLRIKLKHAVDTSSMVSGDFHLHMKNSPDSAVSLEDRVISCVGEGLELMVSTDHNFITDLAPVVKKLGLGRWVNSIVGNEITTRKHFFGHFIAFPLQQDLSKPFNGASAYEKVTAAELMAAATSGSQDQVLQINHPRAGDIGYFDRLQVSEEDGTTTHPNWCDKFTAIEVFNGKRIQQAEPVLKDWFNFLNLGYKFTALGNSDSHKVFDAEPGYARNYITLPQPAKPGQPKGYTSADIVKAVNHDHAVLVTDGPIITLQGPKNSKIGAQIKLESETAEFKIRIEAANFIQPNRVELWANGKIVKSQSFAETTASLKWEGTLSDNPGRDTWYVVVVRGDRTMFPIVTPEKINGVDHQLTPLAFTNPIWIDRDADNKFTAINQDKYPAMHEDRSAEAKSQLETMTIRSQERKPRKAPANPGES